MLELLDDAPGFPDEAADAGCVAEQAEGDVAGRDEEGRLWGLKAFSGGGGAEGGRRRSGGGIVFVHHFDEIGLFSRGKRRPLLR